MIVRSMTDSWRMEELAPLCEEDKHRAQKIQMYTQNKSFNFLKGKTLKERTSIKAFAVHGEEKLPQDTYPGSSSDLN